MGAVLAYLFPFAIVLFVLFFLVKAAVKSAIDDEKYENKKNNKQSEINKGFSELIKLRDIGLLSNAELKEVIELYQAEKVNNEGYEQYLESFETLNELKEREYFNNEQYDDKINRLKKHYDID